MKTSALFQFILGFILGVAILAVGATGLGFLFFGRMTSSPSKPIFSEEKQENTKVAENKESSSAAQPSSEQEETAEKKSEEQEVAKVEPEKEEEPEEKEEEKLPPGAYKARVTWPQGLSLRAEPNLEAERIGGVEYNWELIILENSSDRKWQKVRLAGSDREGWVKAGNVEKVKEGEEEEN